MVTNNVFTRYAKILALIARPGTEGERRSAIAAKIRMLEKHAELSAGHPVAHLEFGTRYEILSALARCYDRNARGGWGGWTVDTTMTEVVLARYDHKEILGALRILRAEVAEGWVNGEYHGRLDIKMANSTEFMLEEAFRTAAGHEGATEEEIRVALRPPFNPREYKQYELDAMGIAAK